MKNIFKLFSIILFLISCSSATHKEYKGKQFRIAVASANVQGLQITEQEVLDEIQSVLSESNAFELFARRQLELILKEKKLSLTGLVAESNFLKIGEFSEIEGVILVDSFISGSDVFMTIQLFNTKSAEILASSYFKVPNSKAKITESLQKNSYELSNQYVNRANYDSKKGKTKVAVVLLEDSAKGKEAANLNQWIPVLETGLVNNFSLNVISRNQLENIVKTQTKEKNLTLQGLIKNENYGEIGNLSGVEYILRGSLNEIEGLKANKFNIQAIHTRTAMTRTSETIKKKFIPEGLTRVADSIAERITLPKDEWTSHESSGALAATGNFLANIGLLPFKYVYNIVKGTLDIIVIRPVWGLGAGAKVSVVELHIPILPLGYSTLKIENDSYLHVTSSSSNKIFDNEYSAGGFLIFGNKNLMKKNEKPFFTGSEHSFFIPLNFLGNCSEDRLTVACNQPTTISAYGAAGIGAKVTIVGQRIPELFGILFFQNWDLLDSGIKKERLEYFTE